MVSPPPENFFVFFGPFRCGAAWPKVENSSADNVVDELSVRKDVLGTT